MNVIDEEKEKENDGSELSYQSVRDGIEEDEQMSDDEGGSAIVELKVRRENMPFDTHRASSKTRRLKGILRPKTWPNPFVQGRYAIIEIISFFFSSILEIRVKIPMFTRSSPYSTVSVSITL